VNYHIIIILLVFSQLLIIIAIRYHWYYNSKRIRDLTNFNYYC